MADVDNTTALVLGAIGVGALLLLSKSGSTVPPPPVASSPPASPPPSGSLQCPAGYTVSDNSCVPPAGGTACPAIAIACPGGQTAVQTGTGSDGCPVWGCVGNTPVTATPVCAPGFALVGTNCVQQTTGGSGAATPMPPFATPPDVVCPAGQCYNFFNVCGPCAAPQYGGTTQPCDLFDCSPLQHGPSTPPYCPIGTSYSIMAASCVQSMPTTCPSGYSWSNDYWSCVQTMGSQVPALTATPSSAIACPAGTQGVVWEGDTQPMCIPVPASPTLTFTNAAGDVCWAQTSVICEFGESWGLGIASTSYGGCPLAYCTNATEGVPINQATGQPCPPLLYLPDLSCPAGMAPVPAGDGVTGCGFMTCGVAA